MSAFVILLSTIPLNLGARMAISTHTSLINRGGQAGNNPNFGGLVLGCINAKFCKWILIFQDFSRSIIFYNPLHRCKFKICGFFHFFAKFPCFFEILQNFAEFSLESIIFRQNFHRILSELPEIPDNWWISVCIPKISRNFWENFDKLSEIWGRQAGSPFDPPSPQSQSAPN